MRTPGEISNQRISVASRLSISTLLLLLLCAASSAAADASSAACSPNVASSFAPPLAAGTPASALCCSLPLFYTFALPAPSAATLRATSSSASNATADDVIVTHELLGADGGRLFAAAQPATGDLTYNLDAGTYLVRVAATPLSRPAYFSFPVTLLLTTAAASGACAAADTNDTLDAPITQYPALISGSICPSTDADTYGFYLDHPARLVFNTSDAIRVTANDSESGGAVIVGATEERRPVTVLFQPGNHLITVEAAPNSFFSAAYTLSITEDNATAIDPACNRSGSVRTSVTLPFQTSFTQCSYSDRAHFTFALPAAQLVAIQFAGAAPGIAALRTVTGELVAYAFQNGEASQSFYLPPGNYTLQVPAAADAQAASVAPLTDPQNVTVSINASSASCPDGAIAAAYDSAATVSTLPVNQQVTVCANSTEGLVAGAETTVWFAFDSAASRFTDATLPGSPTALASAAAYDITGSAYALPAVLPAGRFKLALVLARPLPTFVLNLTQVAVNVNGSFVVLPASINATTNGAFPTQFFFTLPSAQRVTVTPQVAQDITAATGENIVLPLRVRLFERCGWLDVCALYGDGRGAVPATGFYPGIFPTGRFSINLPLNQATNLDLARGTYGIELIAFAATPVNFSLTVSNGTDLACAADAVEPNDSPATAANFTLNSTVSATFCPINDRDFYLLTLPASQRVTIVYNGDVDSSLFVVNRLDAAQLMQLPTSGAPSSLLLGAGAWLVLVAPPVSLVNSSTSLSAQAAYQLSINSSDEACSTAPAAPAVASGLPFAGNLTQLCASAANTSFTLPNATVVDIIVLSPSRLPWVLSNATGAPIVATDEPKATVALLPGTYNVEVFSTVFNSSSFQLLIVATNASSAACLPDQFAANSNRPSAANVSLPFIAQLSSCGSSGTWLTFSLNFLSRLTITASRGAEAFAVAAAGETSNVWSTDVCFVAYSGNDTVPLFSSCGAAAHTLPPATYALNVQGSGAPFNLTVSAVPAVGLRQAGDAASLGASAALVLVALSAVLAALL